MPVRMLPDAPADERMRELDRMTRSATYSLRARNKRNPTRKRRVFEHEGPEWAASKRLGYEERRRKYLMETGQLERLREEFPCRRK